MQINATHILGGLVVLLILAKLRKGGGACAGCSAGAPAGDGIKAPTQGGWSYAGGWAQP